MRVLGNISKKFQRSSSNGSGSGSGGYAASSELNEIPDAAESSGLAKHDQEEEVLQEVDEIKEFDILLGRGRTSWNRTGNKKFRSFVGQYLKQYMEASNRNEKTQIVHKIYDGIIAQGGRFLKQDTATGKWVTVERKVAREKIAHALRDAIGLRIKLGEDCDADETTQQLLKEKQDQRQMKKQNKMAQNEKADFVASQQTILAQQHQQNQMHAAIIGQQPFFSSPALPPAQVRSSAIVSPLINESQAMPHFHEPYPAPSSLQQQQQQQQQMLSSTQFLASEANQRQQQQQVLSTNRFSGPDLAVSQQPEQNENRASLLSLVDNMLTEFDTPSDNSPLQTSLDGDFQLMSLNTTAPATNNQSSLERNSQLLSVTATTSGRPNSFTSQSGSSLDDFDVSSGFGLDIMRQRVPGSQRGSAMNAPGQTKFPMQRNRPRARFQHQRQDSFDSMDSKLHAPLEAMSDFGSVRDDMSMASSIKTEKTNLTKQSIDISVMSTDTEVEWRKVLSVLKKG